MKRFGKFRRKVSWLVKRYGKCGRNVGWLVIRYKKNYGLTDIKYMEENKVE